MNYLDIIITACVLYALVKGFSNGLIKEITALISLFLGVYAGVNFSEQIQPKIEETFSVNEPFAIVLAFSILFLVTFILVRIMGKLMDKTANFFALGLISKLLGAVFGVFKIVVLFSFLLYLNSENKIISKKNQQESLLFKTLAHTAQSITPHFQNYNLIFEEIEKKTEDAKNRLKRTN